MKRSAIHPGEHLAAQLGVPTDRVTAILHGRRSITGDTALRLGLSVAKTRSVNRTACEAG